MKHMLLTITCLLTLPACQTVRTVYDDSGNEVQEHTGVERSLEDYMQETFDREVTRKKNEDGVPESSSTKVSRYQKDIDAARRQDKTFSTGNISLSKEFSGQNLRFGESNKNFDSSKRYTGGMSTAAYSKDLRPDFMSDTKGIYSRQDAYGGFSANDRAEGEGFAYDAFDTAHSYGTSASNISRDATSGYYESRKNKFEQPRIINHRDYYKKSLFETRALLGRDNEPTEE